MLPHLKRIAPISARLREAMDLKEKKQVDLVRETGIDKGSISHYLSGRYEPKQESVKKLAVTLGVSELWLCGYDVPMVSSRQIPYECPDDENPYVLEVSDDLEGMEVDNQIYVRDWIREFKKDPEKMKNSPGEPQLTEGESVLLDLFRRVPEDKQELVLQMIRAALGSQQ